MLVCKMFVSISLLKLVTFLGINDIITSDGQFNLTYKIYKILTENKKKHDTDKSLSKHQFFVWCGSTFNGSTCT